MFWVRSGAVVLVSGVLAFILSAWVLSPFSIPSESMVPTLLVGDRVVVSALDARLTGVQRGEVVVFKDPGGWLDPKTSSASNSAFASSYLVRALAQAGATPSDGRDMLVKRVVGVAGDRVACCSTDGLITVNGVPLVEPYVSGPTDQVRFDVVVPADAVFVLGDNRENSADSRFHLAQAAGSVPLANVVGRAWLLAMPWSHARLLTTPRVFDALPLRSSS